MIRRYWKHFTFILFAFFAAGTLDHYVNERTLTEQALLPPQCHCAMFDGEVTACVMIQKKPRCMTTTGPKRR